MQDLPSPLIYISKKLLNNTHQRKTAPNVMGAVVDMEALEVDLILGS
jgi:hypothetical protein